MTQNSPDSAYGEVEAYKAAGVDYSVLDASKRLAISAALTTSSTPGPRGVQVNDNSRGEPAFVFDIAGRDYALVMECLGTKSSIAVGYFAETGLDTFAAIGYDTVAAAANDLICVGALPLVVNAYFATGATEWHSQGTRFKSLIEGWRSACIDAGAAWGGGESPTLPGIVNETEVDLAASALGVLPEGASPLFGELLEPGDEVVLLASSGLHTNGLSLARRVANTLPQRYSTALPSGTTYGAALLTPSYIYAPIISSLYEMGTPISYISHITGHGLRKLMRARRELAYHIVNLPPVPEVFDFILARSSLSAYDAYATFNMGTGLAIYCRPGYAEDIVLCARGKGIDAVAGGYVSDGERQVVIHPLSIRYEGANLNLR